MRSKLSLQTLAFAGIIAVSGLPAFAAEMTPATPAPGAAVQSDVKAGASGAGNAAVGTNTKVDAKIVPTDKDKKDMKDAKAPATKDVQAAKDKDKTQQVQTAKLPAASASAPTSPAPQVPAPTATVNGSTSTSVQH